MAVVDVPGQEPWIVARWAFCHFLEDVQDHFGHDAELVERLEASMALDGVILDLMDGDLARRVPQAMLTVADATARGESGGEVRGETLAPESQRQYVEAVAELAEKLRAAS